MTESVDERSSKGSKQRFTSRPRHSSGFRCSVWPASPSSPRLNTYYINIFIHLYEHTSTFAPLHGSRREALPLAHVMSQHLESTGSSFEGVFGVTVPARWNKSILWINFSLGHRPIESPCLPSFDLLTRPAGTRSGVYNARDPTPGTS